MRAFKNLSSWPIPLIFWALIATPMASQEDAGAVFGERIEVRVLNLEVVVTDPSGERVTGLDRKEFRLWIDGEERSIDYFTEVRGGVVVGDGTESVAPAAELGEGQKVPTHYLVFIDEYFAVEAQRNQVLTRLLDQVDALGPEDRMSIVAFDGRRVEELIGWSGSRERLAKALEAARSRPAHGQRRALERERRVGGDGGIAALGSNQLDEAPTAVPGFSVASNTLSLADQKAELEREIAAAISALRISRPGVGRKVALMVVGTWPTGPFYEPGQPVDLSEAPRDRDVILPLIYEANRLGYTLYPIDVPSRPEIFRQSTLRQTAADTGGRALLYERRFEALERVVEDTRSYYWLGVAIEGAGEGETREIRVEAVDPELEIRSRSGFGIPSHEEQIEMDLEAALFLGRTLGAPLRVESETVKRRGAEMIVPLKVVIPLAAVTFLPAGEDRYHAEAELFLTSLDARGERSEVAHISLDLDRREPPDPQFATVYETEVTLRRRPHTLAVALHDPASGRYLVGWLEVAP